MRSSIRDILGALAVLVASVVGLVAVTPVPWWVALMAGTLLGALLLLVDVSIFDRPVKRKSQLGFWTIATLILVAGASALSLAFVAGHEYQLGPERYAFLVTNSSGPLTSMKSVPLEGAETNRIATPGNRVWVECYINQDDGLWYRLSDSALWLRESELIPSPHTGEGPPPRCPD